MANWQPLGAYEYAKHGFTHRLVLNYSDVTSNTSGTAFGLFPTLNGSSTVPEGMQVEKVAVRVTTAFAGTSLSALTLTIGDAGSANRFLTSSDVMATAGTWYSTQSTPYVYSAATIVKGTLTATGAALSALTAGKIEIFAAFTDLNDLR